MGPLSVSTSIAGVLGAVDEVLRGVKALQRTYDGADFLAQPASLLFGVQCALEELAALRAAPDYADRSSPAARHLADDLVLPLQTAALLVAFLRRHLSPIDPDRPTRVDRLRFASLRDSFAQAARSLGAQVAALQLLLSVYQCGSLDERTKSPIPKNIENVLQELVDCAASLALDEKDIDDAADFLSKDPAVRNASDQGAVRKRLYKEAYKDLYSRFQPATVNNAALFSRVSTIPLQAPGLTPKSPDAAKPNLLPPPAQKRSASPASAAVDPLISAQPQLPFLGLPFAGEEEDETVVSPGEPSVDAARPKPRHLDTRAAAASSSPAPATATGAPKRRDASHDGVSGGARRKRSATGPETESPVPTISPERPGRPFKHIAALSVQSSPDTEHPPQTGVDSVLDEPGELQDFTTAVRSARKNHAPSLSASNSLPRDIDSFRGHISQQLGSIPKGGRSPAHPSASTSHLPLRTTSRNPSRTPSREQLPTTREEGEKRSASRSSLDARRHQKSPSVPVTRKRSISASVPNHLPYKAVSAAASTDHITLPFADRDTAISGSRAAATPPHLKPAPLMVTSPGRDGSATHPHPPISGVARRMPPPTVIKVPKALVSSSSGATSSDASQAKKSRSRGGSAGASLNGGSSPAPARPEPRRLGSNAFDAPELVPSDAPELAPSDAPVLVTFGASDAAAFDAPEPVYSDDTSTLSGSIAASRNSTIGSVGATTTPTTQFSAAPNKALEDMQVSADAGLTGGLVAVPEGEGTQKKAFLKSFQKKKSKSDKAQKTAPRTKSTAPKMSKVFGGEHASKQKTFHEAAAAGNIAVIKENLKDKAKLINSLEKLDDEEEAKTPLMRAAAGNHLDLVELLATNGADYGIADKSGQIAIHHAIENDAVDAVHFFAERLRVSSVYSGTSARGPLEMADNTGAHPIHVAARKGNVEILRVLLKRGAKIDACDKSGRTALHPALENLHYDAFKYLVRKGADIKTFDHAKRNVLMWAVEANLHKAVKLLLDSGASRSEVDADGNQAVHIAAEKGYVTTLEMLYKTNEDLEVENSFGERPIHLAAGANKPRIVKVLLKAGCTPVCMTKSNSKAPSRKKTWKAYAATPLHYACAAGAEDIVEMLLFNGHVNVLQQVNTSLDDGTSPLMLAAQAKASAITHVLLGHGANPHAKTVVEQLTALHFALRADDVRSTELLVHNGAELEVLSKKRQTPYRYGTDEGKHPNEASEWLMSYMAAEAQELNREPETLALQDLEEQAQALAQLQHSRLPSDDGRDTADAGAWVPYAQSSMAVSALSASQWQAHEPPLGQRFGYHHDVSSTDLSHNQRPGFI